MSYCMSRVFEDFGFSIVYGLAFFFLFFFSVDQKSRSDQSSWVVSGIEFCTFSATKWSFFFSSCISLLVFLIIGQNGQNPSENILGKTVSVFDFLFVIQNKIYLRPDVFVEKHLFKIRSNLQKLIAIYNF